MTLRFLHRRAGRRVKVEWLDYQGRAKPYFELAGRGSKTQQTYHTHPWRVTDAEGNCLGIYVAPDRDGVIILE